MARSEKAHREKCSIRDTLDRERRQQIESPRALRQTTGKVQADIAAALHIKQPSVSKIENQAERICISPLCAATLRPSAGSWS
jgi:predicted XRE-type DNA-binding protein